MQLLCTRITLVLLLIVTPAVSRHNMLYVVCSFLRHIGRASIVETGKRIKRPSLANSPFHNSWKVTTLFTWNRGEGWVCTVREVQITDMLISIFLMIIISTSLTVPTPPSPRFHVEAWLPFRNREMNCTPLSNYASVPTKNNLKSRLVLCEKIQQIYCTAQHKPRLRVIVRGNWSIIRKWCIAHAHQMWRRVNWRIISRFSVHKTAPLWRLEALRFFYVWTCCTLFSL